MSTQRPAPARESAPPHGNAAPHRELKRKLEKMSQQEIFAISVAAGVHKPDGSLTVRYREKK